MMADLPKEQISGAKAALSSAMRRTGFTQTTPGQETICFNDTLMRNPMDEASEWHEAVVAE
jgi:hypothetical protein